MLHGSGFAIGLAPFQPTEPQIVLEPEDRASTTGSDAALAPAWQVDSTSGQPVLALRGDWIAQSGDIPAFPADGLAGVATGQTVALDIADVGRWDSGLIEFLWDARSAAITGGIAINTAPLPESRAHCLACYPIDWRSPCAHLAEGFGRSTGLAGEPLAY